MSARATYRVSVEESVPSTVLSLRRTVRTDHAGDDIGAGMSALYATAGTLGLLPAGPPTTTYHGGFQPGTTTEVELGLPVTTDENRPDIDEFSIRRVAPQVYARTVHHGDYSDIGAAYQALDRWIADSGLQATGPPTDVYLTAPDEAVTATDLRTEIRIPISSRTRFVRVPAPFDAVAAATRETLRQNGFEILTEADLQATVPAGTAADSEKCLVFGIRNPELADRNQPSGRAAGLLLLCNVAVWADGTTTVVEALDTEPTVAGRGEPALESAARATREGVSVALRTVVRRFAGPAASAGEPSNTVRTPGGISAGRPAAGGDHECG